MDFQVVSSYITVRNSDVVVLYIVVLFCDVEESLVVLMSVVGVDT